ncbi:MAG TPA: alpha/beta hydrolase [Mycobacteriales bacterium]|nr:alpha/beta hydrolase [Mycobacteriales bacterium]
MHLTTADGVRLSARVLPGPGAAGGDVCIVLAHGFGVSTSRASVRAVARGLARHATVLAYDARGHGLSTGVTTLGDLEVLDVDAAVAAARALGHGRVVTCGWSMGGAGVVRHAGLRGERVGGHLLGHPPDAVVTVSGTAGWSQRATAAGPLRRLHAVVETRPGRAWARTVLRTRVATSGWDPLPLSPLDVVGRVAPLPLLVVHGDRDAYFPLEHPRALAAAAEDPVELWIEPGFGHAETAASPDLLDRLGRRAVELAGSAAARRSA